MGKKPESIDIQSKYQSAITLHRQGELIRAINLYYQVLDHFPEMAEVYYNLGLAWHELEQYEESIVAYKQAAELNPHDSDIFYNLGLACKMNDQFDEAEKAYLQALSLGDGDLDILYNLGCCYQDGGAIEQACVVYERVLELAPEYLPALNNLAYLEHLQEHFAAAKELYRRILELDPDRGSARHMYATLSGKDQEAPPPEYIQELFDRYSGNFEENLLKDLEYNTFCILRQAVDSLTGKNSRFEHVLDLGCGTGLAGEAFHSACKRLTGVDLSQNMIERAAEKNLYDELHCADIVEFLKQTGQEYDLIIAADVLPYVGNLSPLLATAKERTTGKGLFCLSAEGTDKPRWELQLTGRYAHHPDYVTETAQQNGWQVLERFPANIRKENGEWIRGSIFVLGRDQQG